MRKLDSGLLFLSPCVTDRVKNFQDGRKVTGYHQTGYSTGEKEGSPIYNASIYVISTVVENTAGSLLDHVRLIQFVCPKGDVLWAYAQKRPDTQEGEYTFKIKSGVGCWKHIVGTIQELGFVENRVDGHSCVKIAVSSEIGSEDDRTQYYDHKSLYHNFDKGYSFHGAHVPEYQIDLAGCEIDAIVINSQNGVLISENENSPRHNATCCDRGYMMKKGGKTLGDVMLLEDTDPDGDMIWIYHEWWYGVGPGVYEMIGGHGKWSGITGSGNSVSFIRARQDEWYMPTWEISWDI